MKKLLFLVLLINTLGTKGQVSYIPGPPAWEQIPFTNYYTKILKANSGSATTSGNLIYYSFKKKIFSYIHRIASCINQMTEAKHGLNPKSKYQNQI